MRKARALREPHPDDLPACCSAAAFCPAVPLLSPCSSHMIAFMRHKKKVYTAAASTESAAATSAPQHKARVKPMEETQAGDCICVAGLALLHIQAALCPASQHRHTRTHSELSHRPVLSCSHTNSSTLETFVRLRGLIAAQLALVLSLCSRTNLIQFNSAIYLGSVFPLLC